MTQKTANSCSINDSSRCQHRLANGTRCRLPIAGNSPSFSPRHLALRASNPAHIPDHDPNGHDTADFSTTLSADAEEFQTAMGIHASLCELYRLLAQARISPRRAAILDYISSLQLRTLPMVDKELNPGDAEQQIIIDVPRPDRSEQPSGQPS